MEKKIYITPVAGVIEMQLPSIMETFSAPEGGYHLSPNRQR